MAELKPSKNYIAKAVPCGTKWLAQFSWPGQVPKYAFGADGTPRQFNTQLGAEQAAKITLAEWLMTQKRLGSNSPPSRYIRMTGAELAIALHRLDITPTFFGFLTGYAHDVVKDFLQDVKPIPHCVRVVAEFLLRDPGAISRIERLTEQVTVDRKEKEPTT